MRKNTKPKERELSTIKCRYCNSKFAEKMSIYCPDCIKLLIKGEIKSVL